MSKTMKIGSIVLGLALAVGCEKEKETVPPTKTPSSPTTPATPATPTTPRTTTMPSGMKDMTDMAPATASAAVSDAQAQAQKLLAQATQYIKDNKLTDADTVLTKLEGMKAQLPQAMQKQVDNLRQMYNTAKSGAGALGGGKAPTSMPSDIGGAKMPTSMPALPGM